MVSRDEFKHTEEGYRRVGEWLCLWNMVEGTLGDAVIAALKLESLSGAIVVANITLRDKIFILRCALSLTVLTSKEKKDKYLKSLNEISNHSQTTRNIVVHNMFLPCEDNPELTEFLVTKAKKELLWPAERWSKAKFEEEYEKMDEWTEIMHQLAADCEKSPPIERLWRERQEHAAPKEAEAPQGLLGLLFHHSQDTQNSNPDPATPKTAAGAPSKPR